MDDALSLATTSPDMTMALGRLIGAAAGPGTILDLRGELGVGKTRFTHGLADGLGVGSGVASPTFTVCHVHQGDTTLYHLDAYRILDPQELLLQGWDDMCEGGVVAVEWGERVEEILPDDRLEIRFEHAGDERRNLRLTALGPLAHGVLEAVRSSRIGEKDSR